MYRASVQGAHVLGKSRVLLKTSCTIKRQQMASVGKSAAKIFKNVIYSQYSQTRSNLWFTNLDLRASVEGA